MCTKILFYLNTEVDKVKIFLNLINCSWYRFGKYSCIGVWQNDILRHFHMSLSPIQNVWSVMQPTIKLAMNPYDTVFGAKSHWWWFFWSYFQNLKMRNYLTLLYMKEIVVPKGIYFRHSWHHAILLITLSSNKFSFYEEWRIHSSLTFPQFF